MLNFPEVIIIDYANLQEDFYQSNTSILSFKKINYIIITRPIIRNTPIIVQKLNYLIKKIKIISKIYIN